MLLLAVEIGGTKVQAVLGTDRGEIRRIRRGVVDAGRGAEGILSWLQGEMPKLVDESPLDAPIEGIGIGFGGPVDSAAGRVLTSHQIEGWSGFPLREWFEEQFGVPAIAANDSNAAGWAEYCAGAGRGSRNMAYMNIGSGIGGALIVDGRLYDAQGLGAGEIGHTFIPAPTERGGCHADKLENSCSGWAIEQRARREWAPAGQSPLDRLTGGDADEITCEILGEAARQGDAFALNVIADVTAAVGIAAGNLCSLFCPEKLVVGGGVAEMGAVLLDPLRKETRARTIGAFQGRTEIVPASLGGQAVPVGALLLAGAAVAGRGC